MASAPNRLIVVAALACVLLAAHADAQRAASPGGQRLPDQQPTTNNQRPSTIRGRVVGADNNLPLPHAWVSLTPGAQPTLTDRDGRFEFTGLSAGRYHLSASKRSYLLLEHGQRRPGEPGKPLQLSDGQVLDIGDFLLPRASVLGGIILDDGGEGVPDVVITVLRRQFVNGAMRLVPAATRRPDPTVTDDLGQYRVANLPPGTYYVAALPPQRETTEGDARAFAPTYYPGGFDSASAGPVFLGIGSERLDLHFPLLSGPPVTISGVVVDSRGQPARGVVVKSFQAMGDAASSDGMDGPRATTRPDGTFRIARVRPGLHRLSVDLTNAGTGEQEHGETTVMAIGVDADAVYLATLANARATGRVRVDAAASVPLPAPKVSIVASGNSGMAPVFGDAAAPNWTFDVRGIAPGPARRFGVAGLPAGWDVAAVRCAGTDITDTGMDVGSNQRLTDIEIVLTNRLTELNGTASDAQGKPVVDYTVVVFSEDRTKWVWRSRSLSRAAADQDGRFAITGLRPGAYFAAAVDYLEEGTEYDPEVLDRLRAGATRVTLEAGDKKTIQLAIGTGGQ